MKKFLSILLVAIMLVSVLAGCGKKTATDDGEVPTLIYYVPGNTQADESLVEEAINAIAVPKIGAKVDLNFIDFSAWTEKMNNKMAANEYFDLSCGYALNNFQLVDNGCTLALDELLETEAPALKAQVPDYMWEQTKFNGEIHFVPNEQIACSSEGIVVRKELADEFGLNLDEINVISDLEPFWQFVKEKHPDLIPYRMSNASHFYPDVHGKQFSTEGYHTSLIFVDFETMKVGATPECYTKEVADFAYDLSLKGYFREDRSGADDSSYMASGRYASWYAWCMPGCEAEFKKSYGGYDYVTKILTPKPTMSATSALATTTFVSAYTKYPEKSIKFVELLNTDKEIYNLITFGIEGRHYEKIDEKYIKVIEGSGYYTNSGWAFGCQWNAYLQEGQEPDVWEQTKKLNDEAIKSPIAGLTIDTSEIIMELNQCEKVQQKYLVSRINRAVGDPDTYWEDYKKELKMAGIDKVIECYQTQIDAFLANK